MADGRMKQVMLKWMLPLGILVAVFIGLLIQFITVAYSKAVTSVESYLKNEVQQYAEEVENQIEYMTDIGQPIAYVLEHFEDSDPEFGVTLRNMLVEDSDANLIVYANISGEGLTQEGTLVDFRAKSYYLPCTQRYQVYSYTEKDDILGEASIVSAIPVVDEEMVLGVMYMFYPTSQIRHDYYSNELFDRAHMMVMNKEGNILFNGGAHTVFLKNANTYDILKRTGNEKACTDLRVAVRNHEVSIMEVNGIEDSSYMVIVPLLVNDTFITLTYDQEYVQTLIDDEWKSTQYVIFNIILAFVVLVLASCYVLYIINRVYKERNKRLEKKADKE